MQWHSQFDSLPNQSDFHNIVRDIFRSGWFKTISCFQEVPVCEIVLDYENRLHRFDWWIPTLNTVVELHGTQHYRPTAFGSMSANQKQRNFKDSQQRDQMKKEAAEDNGIKYVAIDYKMKDKIDETYLKQQIFGAK